MAGVKVAMVVAAQCGSVNVFRRQPFSTAAPESASVKADVIAFADRLV
jgi:hypothetical protein